MEAFPRALPRRGHGTLWPSPVYHVRSRRLRSPREHHPFPRRRGSTPRGGFAAIMSVTTQSRIDATCVSCTELRVFTLSDADTDETIAEYECTACGHQVQLDLDP